MERIVELYTVELPRLIRAKHVHVVRESIVVLLPEGNVGEAHMEVVQTWSTGEDTIAITSEIKSPRIREKWQQLRDLEPWLRVAKW